MRLTPFALGMLAMGSLTACGEEICADNAECVPSSGGAGGSGANGSGGSTSTGGEASSTTSTSMSTNTSTGSSMDEATVNLTFTGCAPSFTGDLVVASNADSVAVSTTVPPISNLQLALSTTSGAISISTAERVANGDIINLVTMNTTWTNISSAMPDPISGSITINAYEEQAGIVDVVFHDVVLENVQDHGLCTINGSLKTTGTSF